MTGRIYLEYKEIPRKISRIAAHSTVQFLNNDLIRTLHISHKHYLIVNKIEIQLEYKHNQRVFHHTKGLAYLISVVSDEISCSFACVDPNRVKLATGGF